MLSFGPDSSAVHMTATFHQWVFLQFKIKQDEVSGKTNFIVRANYTNTQVQQNIKRRCACFNAHLKAHMHVAISIGK